MVMVWADGLVVVMVAGQMGECVAARLKVKQCREAAPIYIILYI